MLFLLSGEGVSDIGQNNPTEEGWQFEAGPMCCFIDALYQEQYDVSPLHDGYFKDIVIFLHKKELETYAATLKQDPKHRIRFLPSEKFPNKLNFHGINACALGIKAKDLSSQYDDEVIAVFFHDSDLPNDHPRYYLEKLHSMDNGFARTDYGHKCVAMVARPKSEAWILCVADNYTHGKQYEEASGNDDSPFSLKKQLLAKLQTLGYVDAHATFASSEEIRHFLMEQDLDINKLAEQQESFKEFVIRFRHAVQHF